MARPPVQTRTSLDDWQIASPCHASWEAMAGDDRVRFCGECRKNVYDLRGMTREEAEGLLRERSGDLCVRLYRRADGTVLTEDCPVGAEQKPSEPRVRMGRFLPPSFEQLLSPDPKRSPKLLPKARPRRR